VTLAMRAEFSLLAQQVADDLIGYRNYLRGIWSAMERRSPITPDEAVDQLNRRFHQDFRTTETTLKPANDLVNVILRTTLIAPRGAAYGFAVDAASIEAQGARTSSEYQTYLVGRTGLSSDEISVRYRLDTRRPADAKSSAMVENIGTLLAFFRDAFQCGPEPFPIIPLPAGAVHYDAPFFLEFSEWLQRNQPYYAENYYQIRPAFAFEVPLGWKSVLGETRPDAADLPLAAFNKYLREGINHAVQGECRLAAESFAKVEVELASVFRHSNFRAAIPGDGFYVTPSWVFAPGALEDFSERSALKLRNASDLERLSAWFENTLHEPLPRWRIQFGLIHFAACVLPVILGDLALATGDYANAVRHYLRTLEVDDVVGMASIGDPSWPTSSMNLHVAGDLPYSYDTYGGHPRRADTDLSIWPFNPDLFVRQGLPHPMEKRFFRLRLGNALLEWASSLYRGGLPASLARARELYKAVSWLHGDLPPVAPDWSKEVSFTLADELVGPAASAAFLSHYENPARASQRGSARLGFYQLEAGLNYYGFAEDAVPSLRYRPLKIAADRLASLAKTAQLDFLTFMDKLEGLEKESIQAANLIRKATLQASLADQEIAIAQDGVTRAKAQRDDVLAAVDAKRAELAKHDDFFEQFGDYLGGMLDTVGKIKSAGAAPAKGGDDGKEVTGVDLGVTTLEGGSAIMAGFGAFWVASYLTMSGMADAANQRRADLEALVNKVLPAAEAQIVVRQRYVAIGELQKRIAQADAELAQELLHFNDQRFLNSEFWAALATVMKRLLRRYLDMGARTAWLAERALAYEQDSAVEVIRFDYFPLNAQGVPGADMLQADLEELEALRLNGIKSTVPIKHTFSLSRDFPLQFGQLKKTGRCLFHTREEPLRWAYPGTYGYRVRAVTPVVQTIEASPAVRGLLTHEGATSLTRKDGTSHVLVRPRESLPLSEFRMREDMALHGLPDEALLTFEGSGVDAFWTLELPAIANPYGLDGVADVILTIDARASHSAELQALHLATLPKTVNRSFIVSAQKYDPAAMTALRDPTVTADVTIDFDIAAVALPKAEKSRHLTNLGILLAGKRPLDMTVEFSATTPAVSRTIAIKEGVALSNAPPVGEAGDAAAPLNAFVGALVDQHFRLTLNVSGLSEAVRSRLSDVLLVIDYVAVWK
jgi:hypothetical protein